MRPNFKDLKSTIKHGFLAGKELRPIVDFTGLKSSLSLKSLFRNYRSITIMIYFGKRDILDTRAILPLMCPHTCIEPWYKTEYLILVFGSNWPQDARLV